MSVAETGSQASAFGIGNSGIQNQCENQHFTRWVLCTQTLNTLPHNKFGFLKHTMYINSEVNSICYCWKWYYISKPAYLGHLHVI